MRGTAPGSRPAGRHRPHPRHSLSPTERRASMVDESAIGYEAEPYDMVVERGKIREFARATMSRNPDYFDDPVAVSPPTFLMASSFWATGGGPTAELDI